MADDYKKIVIPGNASMPSLDVELEPIEEEQEQLVEVEVGDAPAKEPEIEEEQEIELEPEKEEVKPVSDKEAEQPKKKRGPYKTKTKKRDKRIKQLVDTANTAKAEKEALEQELHSLKQQLSSSNKASNETVKNTVESTISSLKGQLETALEDGDSQKAVQIQEDLVQAHMKLASVSYELDNYQEVPEYKPQQAPTEPDPRAMDWVEDHPEFNTDREFHRSALGTNEDLLLDGFNPQSDEFFEELDKRLSKRFPEYFDISSENVVQSNKASKSKGTENNLDEDEIEVPQTVSGASRTPTGTASGKRRKSKNTVILTKEEQIAAQRMGLSPSAMAERKRNIELSEDDGYTPITIK